MDSSWGQSGSDDATKFGSSAGASNAQQAAVSGEAVLGDSGFGEQSFEVSVELAGTLQLKGSIGGSSEPVVYGRDPGTVCVDVWFVRSGVVDVGEGGEVDVVGFLVWHDESGKKLARVARDARAVLESGDSTVKEVDSLVVFDEVDDAALSKDSTLIERVSPQNVV